MKGIWPAKSFVVAVAATLILGGCGTVPSPFAVLDENACGGRGALPEGFALGEPCESLCDAGVWTCDGETGKCLDVQIDACGGCAGGAAPMLGATCGDCDAGTWTCEDDAHLCLTDAGLPPTCCSEPTAHPGDPCGPCGDGELFCSAARDVCDGATELNECGGCGELEAELGAECGACDVGVFECVDGRAQCVGDLVGEDQDSDGILDGCDCDFSDLVCDGIHTACTQTEDGPTCVCAPGYELGEEGCFDTNDCAAAEPMCPPLSVCVDQVGGVQCLPCATGFVESGGSCCSEPPIGVGWQGGCAIFDGRLKCWGLNEFGSLGLGDTETRGDEPGEMGENLEWVELGVRVVAVKHERMRTCALSNAGQLYCWGQNDRGQAGIGNREDLGDEPGEVVPGMPPVNLGAGRTVIQFDISAFHTCALLDTNEVKCWGANGNGQLGVGHTRDIGDDSGEMEALESVVFPTGVVPATIELADTTSCVLSTAGEVYCWGAHNEGSLGYPAARALGTREEDIGMLRTADLGDAPVVQLSVGFRHACALFEDGIVKCWGNNAEGRLGIGGGPSVDQEDQFGEALPFEDFDGIRVVSVHVGGHHTCVLLADNSLRCAGRNSQGQAGQPVVRSGSHVDGVVSFTRVNLRTDSEILAVQAGDGITCAIFADGDMSCFGANSLGGLGLGHSILPDPTLEDFATLPALDLAPGQALGCAAAESP